MNLLKDKRQKDWFWIENKLIDRTDLTIYEKMVYAVLVRHSDNNSSCFPSHSTIASKAGCSDRKVRDCIKTLIDKEIIHKENRIKVGKKEKDSNLYYIGSVKGTEPHAVPTEPHAVQVRNHMPGNTTNINNNIYSRVITRLNELTSKDYKSTTNKTQRLIQARMNEGFTEDNFYNVIENKVSSWKNTDMEKYLRPDTLFGTKFEGYLNECSKKSTLNKKTDNGVEFYPEIEFEDY